MIRKLAPLLAALSLAAGCGGAEQKGALLAQPAGVVRDESPMSLVPAGTFYRGREAPVPIPRGEEPPDSSPGRTLYLDAFYIDRFEVSNDAYARFVAETGHPFPRLRGGGPRWGGDWSRFSWKKGRPPLGAGDLPVTLVSWFDAEAYCAWVGKRLPTEAEWEKAARGTDRRVYPWGDAFAAGRANAGKKYEGPVPGGSFPGGASPYGVMDMAGNVAEWVSDYYDPAYYAVAPARNPKGPARGGLRSARGGYWSQPPEVARTDRRFSGPPAGRHGGVGFRCARPARGR
ncbi:MAG: SUMF1/EgtB/PvdO family nonheme iron enzyme [bacterium]